MLCWATVSLGYSLGQSPIWLRGSLQEWKAWIVFGLQTDGDLSGARVA